MTGLDPSTNGVERVSAGEAVLSNGGSQCAAETAGVQSDSGEVAEQPVSTPGSTGTTTTSSSTSTTTSSSTGTTTSSDVSCRVWIGNLDLRVSELRLLQLLRSCGQLTGFDLPLHRSGPQAGRPRGFAFASFAARREALRAMTVLDGQLVGERYLRTRWALQSEHVDTQAPSDGGRGKRLAEVEAQQPEDVMQDEKTEEAAIPATLNLSTTDAKIRAIEQALAASSEAGDSGSFSAGRGAESSGFLPRIRPVVSYINAANRPPGANQRSQRRPRERFRAPRRPYRRR